MGRYETAVYADLASLRAPSRFRLRRRHAPGPLRTLSPRRNRIDVGMVSMVAIAAAVAAGLFVVPYAMQEAPPAPKPVVANNLVTDRPSEPAAIVKRIGMAPVQAEAAQPRPATPVAESAHPNPSAAPAAARDASMFRVDQLPMLEDDGAAFDVDLLAASVTTQPPRPARAPRRTPSSEQASRLPQP